MAKFDVYRSRGVAVYLLDCQADLLSDLNTRFVVPLMLETDAPKPAARLNPVFEIEGKPCVMVTQFAATVPVSELKVRLVSLREDSLAIGNALDMLICGF
ncbi:CcdB family protein [Sphingobium sp. ba1]|jgi:toxin CcdB|uniref:CcdB family protein n=1 Tax=Sphingobium sp. ba1 TaxID=1522072 RepID=UPI00056D045D|nr:CcdB family protein [Sphingobium sp. ba1]